MFYSLGQKRQYENDKGKGYLIVRDKDGNNIRVIAFFRNKPQRFNIKVGKGKVHELETSEYKKNEGFKGGNGNPGSC